MDFMAANGSSNSPMPTAPNTPEDLLLPPRLSFLGLPLELRLQIYTYLLHSPSTPSQHDTPGCCRASHPNRSTDNSCPILCSCTGLPLAPQILVVSKQVFAESMPVLYANAAFRVQSSTFPGEFVTYHSFNILNRLPAYSHDWISQLVVVVSFVLFTSGPPNALAYLSHFFKDVSEQCPRVRRLRLHLDVWGWQEGGVECVGAVAELAGLRGVVVQVHDRSGRVEGEVVGVGERVRDAVRERAREVGREKDVVVELLGVREEHVRAGDGSGGWKNLD